MADLGSVGNYILIEEIASGAFGRVFKANHKHLTSRLVAVKLLRQTYFTSVNERESFFQEAEILEKLRHPHVLPLYDTGLHQDIPYLVTQYAPGGSLRDRLQKHQKLQKLLPLQDSLTILSQIASAIEYAHQNNVIHRDLKPENILFDDKGNALLADFGISTTLNTASFLQVTMTGTPAYMAPEQFKGQISKESDQYALGCMAFELFTGYPLFTAPDFFSMGYKHIHELPPSLKTFNPTLPDELEQSILKSLEKERKSRFPTVMIFIHTITNPFQEVTAQSIKTAQQWFEEGKVYIDQEDYEPAVVSFKKATQLDPNNALYYHNVCVALHKLERYQDVLPYIEKAVDLDPNNSDYQHDLGFAYFKLNQFYEAIPSMQQAIDLDPDNAKYHYSLGRVFSKLKLIDDAKKYFERAYQLKQFSAELYQDLGYALYNIEDFGNVFCCFERAIELEPDNVKIYQNFVEILFSLKCFKEAIPYLQRAIEIDPNNAKCYEDICLAFVHLDRFEEAIPYLKRMIEFESDNSTYYLLMVRAVFECTQFEEAIPYLQRALELDPNNEIILHNIGFLLCELQRYDEAIPYFDHALEIDSTYERAIEGKEMALEHLK